MKLLIISPVAALVMAGTAVAGPCKAAKGKFIKCPPVAATAARCRDAKGQFEKCSVPGAKTV